MRAVFHAPARMTAVVEAPRAVSSGGQPHPAAVRSEPPWKPGRSGGGGAVFEIAHVGGGPILVGLRAAHGQEDRACGGGWCHVAPEAGQHAVGLGSADGGPGQCGPEGDGGDHERGGGWRAALLEQTAEVGGQRGIGRRRGAAPGVELTQRAAVGSAGVGAQGVRGEVPGGRGESPGSGSG